MLLLIALCISITDLAHPLLAQERVGFDGRIFSMWKFRTMVPFAEENGPVWASQRDPRVTKVGRFLRFSHLDELPQLWNIFQGQMSFIGPRPERPQFHEVILQKVPRFEERLQILPGLTGLAQVELGYAADLEASTQKLSWDLKYIEQVAPSLDFKILLKTLRVFGRAFLSKYEP